MGTRTTQYKAIELCRISLIIVLFGCIPFACGDSNEITCPDTGQAEQIFFSFVENDSVRIASISSDATDFKVIIEYGTLWASPRGELLSYFSWNDVDETGSIYVSNLDGTLIKRISSNDPVESHSIFPVLSPRKDAVVFFTYPHNLFLANINGDGKILLADDAENESIAAFSPAGNKIAYYGTEDKLNVINSDGSGKIALTSSTYCYNDGFACLEWSPDGGHIAYIGNDNGAADVCITSTDGAHSVNLTRDSVEDCWPAWSPNGNRLAYAGGNGYDIWIVNLSDSSKYNLTGTPDEYECFPQWSPDGRKILYITLEPGAEGKGALTMIDVQSKVKKTLYANAFPGFWKK
ncbi:MAG: hypothetical protein ABIA59_03160 [Candidatus Latescibacterota bacterium]